MIASSAVARSAAASRWQTAAASRRMCLSTSANRACCLTTTRRTPASTQPASRPARFLSSGPPKKKVVMAQTDYVTKRQYAAPSSTKGSEKAGAAAESASKSEDRTSGVDALESALTREQAMRNYATATGLLIFVAGVWYYSMHAVGRADFTSEKKSGGGGGIQELLAEAEEARVVQNRQRAAQEREAQALEHVDANISEEEQALLADAANLNLAVAAPDEIAHQEEEKNRKARGLTPNERPLWKRIVFFWK